MRFPEYYTAWHIIGHYALRVTAALVLVFLMLPILVIVPLSFNAQPFFTFTEGMLALDPQAYSLRWYQAIFDNANWTLAIKNSFIIEDGKVGAALSETMVAGNMAQMLRDISGISAEHIDYGGEDFPWLRIPGMHFS